MYGAIIGDIVGSRFEWDNILTKKFDLFTDHCFFTDDSVMTIAVGKALHESRKQNYADLNDQLVYWMHKIGKRYPDCGYGGHFYYWMFHDDAEPYNSFGNGSAMRTSYCAQIAESLEEALYLAEKCAAVTHNHPEGIKGAQAVTACIWLAKEGKSQEEIRCYVREHYYDMDFTLDGIRKSYRFDVTCQGSVPQAIEAFLEAVSFEDAIRNAISIGGDSDTIAAITGPIAEAYFGIPEGFIQEADSYLDDYLKKIVHTIL
ncbi:MAG: ADP-ribosylglycohydrolase family protein [Erysipelotrichaceae bacterium]|nr:ADP-ribosylglycohydrolase family protein [Erysipelotrichaceae bacterium]